jgi:hypothetical protein
MNAERYLYVDPERKARGRGTFYSPLRPDQIAAVIRLGFRHFRWFPGTIDMRKKK